LSKELNYQPAEPPIKGSKPQKGENETAKKKKKKKKKKDKKIGKGKKKE
jgi:hypothetical protein